MEQEKIIEVRPAPETLSLVAKAEIDVQISTAKAFPRSVSESIKRLESLATISPEVADSCGYSLPRKVYKDDGTYETKFIEGPGIRLAEMAAISYGNIRAGSRVVSNDGKKITAQGICHDLESNTCITIEVSRSILTKHGKTYSEDMQTVTGNAACSIALRNSILRVIPRAVIDAVYEKTKKVAAGTAETLEKRRNAALEFFRGYGVKDADICRVLEIKDIQDIDLVLLQRLRGMANAVKNENVPISEIFPPEEKPGKGGKTGKGSKVDNAIQQTIDMVKDK